MEALPFLQMKSPLAAAFFLASATAQATSSSKPRPRGTASQIMQALRDMLINDKLAFPDPILLACNACIRTVIRLLSRSMHDQDIGKLMLELRKSVVYLEIKPWKISEPWAS